MAEKRMFAKSIVLSDAFLDMPMSARSLYFTLGMLADDDGFVGNPRSIMRTIGASDDDMRILISRSFVFIFDSGVVVIKHWRINNYLKNDRYHETNYLEEKSMLTMDKKGAYSANVSNLDTNCIQSGDADKNRLEEYRLEKSRLEENREEKNSLEESECTRARKGSATLEEVRAYCKERRNKVNPERFYNHYQSIGWRVNGQPVQDWKALMFKWEEKDGFYEEETHSPLPESIRTKQRGSTA